MFLTDQLAISVTPNDLVIGKGRTANFTAMATGISSVENNFMYQWMKRDSDSVSDKVSGVNGSVLSIPNVLESDGGSYYCIVTNEWGRMAMSNDVILSIFGMFSISYKSHYSMYKAFNYRINCLTICITISSPNFYTLILNL